MAVHGRGVGKCNIAGVPPCNAHVTFFTPPQTPLFLGGSKNVIMYVTFFTPRGGQGCQDGSDVLLVCSNALFAGYPGASTFLRNKLHFPIHDYNVVAGCEPECQTDFVPIYLHIFWICYTLSNAWSKNVYIKKLKNIDKIQYQKKIRLNYNINNIHTYIYIYLHANISMETYKVYVWYIYIYIHSSTYIYTCFICVLQTIKKYYINPI